MRLLKPVKEQESACAGYTLRPVEAKDLDLVLYHRRQMFVEMGHDANKTDAAIRATESLFCRSLAEGRYRGFFFEDNLNRVVAGGGVITYEFHVGPQDSSPHRSWIVNMYTEPNHRRRGLARMIMAALVDLCRELGWAVTYLHASPDGRPLYESLGFKATNEMVVNLRPG